MLPLDVSTLRTLSHEGSRALKHFTHYFDPLFLVHLICSTAAFKTFYFKLLHIFSVRKSSWFCMNAAATETWTTPRFLMNPGFDLLPIIVWILLFQSLCKRVNDCVNELVPFGGQRQLHYWCPQKAASWLDSWPGFFWSLHVQLCSRPGVVASSHSPETSTLWQD